MTGKTPYKSPIATAGYVGNAHLVAVEFGRGGSDSGLRYSRGPNTNTSLVVVLFVDSNPIAWQADFVKGF